MLGLIMERQITHPSKEQVRAYMAEREFTRRPPPTPEEIRCRLGWHLASSAEDDWPLRLYLMPSTCRQLVARLLLDWLFAPIRAARPHEKR
jgi:hypothetical protein